MCANCKYTPLFEQASSAILFTVHLLQNDVSLPYPPLEGNFDIIWGQVIDRAFISHHGILYRKEKTSSLSPYKFDGLYLSEGSIIPQEWLVLEVSRSSNQGTKQINDRQKLLQHCLRILNHRRSYLSSQTNLQGVELMISLRKFPVWGILCQGFAIEIVKLGWVTRGVGLVSTFVSKYPTHIAKMQNLYRILEQVHMVVV
ncbi:hypothetical protein L211DRAFT_464162 [Terfezia boudieri ATCC MYA-4762]|uniref:Uncharacterized protein n=1 Tax=Terfezia boudieri ATCC MYA-4762 TaxID=1051890 RepID=A0A3N4LK28_9PEZI|nr:hypothetical protein L211DRAFT_464162 [Terfezia boudieri ATCC MYA-4762]